MRKYILSLTVFLFLSATFDAGAQKITNVYEKAYKPGKYRMTISVLKGDVVVANYDEKGPDYKNAITVIEGETRIIEGEIVFMMM